ncbi:MAG: hypothetical protein WBA38_04250 [Gordonia sp. (in: high G+C Gram-positive bacteria)]|uniref:hypothetical protein n=1 Tax=Gordonia sp. (in: high G+C Gram-positive bacteria) TaxID=84139 RepID=UPI003C749A61
MTAQEVDLSQMIQARSDQTNAVDLLAGPVTVTIVAVTTGSKEQPINLVTDHFGPGKPYRPGLSMRRVLVNAWGPKGAEYVGKSMTLYCDPSVRFGGQAVGGIRISHLSHIDKPKSVALTVTRGKHSPFTVDPLPSGPPLITDEIAGQFAADILAAGNVQALDAISVELKKHNLGNHRADLLAAFTARKAELNEAAS